MATIGMSFFPAGDKDFKSAVTKEILDVDLAA